MAKSYLNRLSHEKSPYLLQHAHNPVDWYPWGAEAFESAENQNKPIFLSIGYSTCHWCHVMGHESFEDPLIGALMNDVFVSIKVDREERPDIDMLYMTVCQKMTGSGGWPLTIIMTPDKRPFFAGTYFPKKTRFGRTGLMDLIPRIKETWATRKVDVLDSATQITAAIQKAEVSLTGEDLGEGVLHLAYEQLRDKFDGEHGGFGSAPKFPTAHNLLFLLRCWKRTHVPESLDMVEKTLQAMQRGGMYDHIGFGFHRYSTDGQWLVPHFEKMLYDQALLAMAYTEAYQATGKEEYARTAREIFTYVLRDMTSPNGGFYSAEDADSEGEEGKFYLWTHAEIRDILGPDEADFFIRVFNIGTNGNFTGEKAGGNDGRNILHLTKPLEDVARDFDLSLTELLDRLETAQLKLFVYRQKRVHPYKDDKILADWNGLMVAALATGARVFGEMRYAKVAERAVGFILDNMISPDGRLFHRYRDGQAAMPAHVDDYAFLVHGLLELYETTFDIAFLEKALDLNEKLVKQFWDEKNGGFYFTADDGEALLVRQKEAYDGAVPSGNSIAMLNLLRLAGITADTSLEQKAARIGNAFSRSISQSPSAYTQLLVAVDFTVGPSFELVITGDAHSDDTSNMLKAVRKEYIPNKVVVFVPTGTDSDEVKRIAPFTRDQSAIDHKVTAYVCVNHSCRLPTTDIGTMLSSLNSGQDQNQEIGGKNER